MTISGVSYKYSSASSTDSSSFVSAKSFHQESDKNDVLGQNLVKNSSCTSRLRTVSPVAKNEPDEFEIDHYVQYDEASDKTYSRRLVENVLYKCKWYNPSAEKEGVDLKKGWAFYEHYTLPRRECDKTAGCRRRHVETNTFLFNFFDTPPLALHEWGIGVAIYFRAIQVMGVALLIGGLISIPNIIFFGSEDYHGKLLEPYPILLRGSAVCNNFEWVTCEPFEGDQNYWCNLKLMKKNSIPYAFSDNRTFVKRSLCDGATFSNGMCNYAAVMFLFLVTIIYPYFTKKLEDQVDEELNTASDYSIEIKNPPTDAYDPTEWRYFCEQHAKQNDVVACTIILDNDQLISSLINRRVCRHELKRFFPYEDIDDEETFNEVLKHHIKERNQMKMFLSYILRPIFQPLNMFLPAEKLVEKIKMHTKNAKELQKKEYNVRTIIITFDSETSQRNALESLRVGDNLIRLQRTKGIDEDKLFRGELLLKVERPVEPGALRYRDMSAPLSIQAMRYILTFMIVVGLVLLAVYITKKVRNGRGPLVGGIVTSLMNLIIPQIVRLLLLLEKHSTEGDLQKSLCIKITLFRWCVTVFSLGFLYNHNATLSAGPNLLRVILGVFLSEMLLVPTLRLLDILGLIKKHYLAPRATTQDQMYLNFKGTPYHLAERYSDLSKIVLLSYFFSALYPVALLLGSLTLFIRYYVDKFCLIRIWRPAPLIGNQVTKFNSRYIFILVAVASAYNSALNWINFRFDYVCEGGSTEQDFNGAVTFSNNTSNLPLNVTGGRSVRVCSAERCCQDITTDITIELFTPWSLGNQSDDGLKWGSETQTRLALIYGITAICIIFSYLIYVCGRKGKNLFSSMYLKGYTPQTKDQEKKFSLESISGYIPEVRHSRFSFPLLLCDVDGIDPDMIGWTDPSRSHRDHSLVYDIPNNGLTHTKIMTQPQLDTDDTECNNKLNPISDAPIFDFVTQWNK